MRSKVSRCQKSSSGCGSLRIILRGVCRPVHWVHSRELANAPRLDARDLVARPRKEGKGMTTTKTSTAQSISSIFEFAVLDCVYILENVAKSICDAVVSSVLCDRFTAHYALSPAFVQHGGRQHSCSQYFLPDTTNCPLRHVFLSITSIE